MNIKKNLIARYKQAKGRDLKVKLFENEKYVEAEFLNFVIEQVIVKEIMHNLGKTLCLLELTDLGEELKQAVSE